MGLPEPGPRASPQANPLREVLLPAAGFCLTLNPLQFFNSSGLKQVSVLPSVGVAEKGWR